MIKKVKRIEVYGGCTLGFVFNKAQKEIKESNGEVDTVEFSFNGVECTVKEKTEYKKLFSLYSDILMMKYDMSKG